MSDTEGGPMSTLHDRITALHQPETVMVSVPVFDEFDRPWRVQTQCRECGKSWPCQTSAVLAETTTAQPGCGWCDDGRDVTHPDCDHAAAQPEAFAPCGRGPCCMPDGHPGTCNPGDDLPPGHPAREWSPPVEPEPDERETLAAGEDMDRRLLWLDRAAPTPWKVRVVTDGLPSNGPGGHAVVDANGLALVQTDYDEHGYNLAHLIAQAPDLYRARVALPVEPEPDEREALTSDLAHALAMAYGSNVNAPRGGRDWRAAESLLAAGFRRSRPEATHTVTAEQVEAAHERAAVTHGKSGRARDRAFLIALGVAVVDTPTQGGGGA